MGIRGVEEFGDGDEGCRGIRGMMIRSVEEFGVREFAAWRNLGYDDSGCRRFWGMILRGVKEFEV